MTTPTPVLAQRIADELDAEQADAIRAFGPRTLVVAGAGSGKTRVLTYGLAHLIEDHGIDPSELMLLTFTRKAAEEMRERAQKVTSANLDELRCGTFHAVGAVLLRDAGREFAIIDEYEAELMVRQLGAELFQEREVEGFISMDPSKLLGWYSDVRESDIELDELLWEAPEYYRDRRSLIEDLYTRYCERKAEEKLFDYADVLWETRELLRGPDGPQVREKLRAVLVDEVQDLNPMQRDIVDELTNGGAWLIEVGDAEQSIYGFRRASYESLLLRADDPAITVRKLETNYRSTEEIVALAKELVPQTKLTLDVQSHRGPSGLVPQLWRPETEAEEAQRILDWAQEHLTAGAMPEQLCVLARAHDHLKVAERVLTHAGYEVALLGRRQGDFDQFRQFLLALMRLCVNPHDRSAWQRVLPIFGFDTEEQYARMVTLRDAADPLGMCTSWAPKPFIGDLLGILKGADPNAWLWQRVCMGPFATLLSRNLTEPERLPHLLSALNDSGQRDGDGVAYLNALALSDSAGTTAPGIRLGTVHASKGLEWKHVTVVRCSYTAFPSKMAVIEDGLDEENRLFYVAITRAEDTVTVCEAPWLNHGDRHSVDFLARRDVREHFEEAAAASELCF